MGVLVSLPSQKGQAPGGAYAGSGLPTRGRLARSVAMMTQRPTIGSLRNSGRGRPRRATLAFSVCKIGESMRSVFDGCSIQHPSSKPIGLASVDLQLPVLDLRKDP